MNIAIFLLQIILQLAALRIFFTMGQMALGAFVVLEAILANIFVSKQIVLFGLSVTAADSFIIGSMLGLSLYQEYFGKEASRKLCFVTFLSMFFVTVVSIFHLWLIPHTSDISHEHYKAIFSSAPRIVTSSLIAYFIASRMDVVIFAFLRDALPQYSFAKRALISTVTTQALDTLCFSVLGLYGQVDHLLHIIIFSFTIKVICLLTYLLLQPIVLKTKTA